MTFDKFLIENNFSRIPKIYLAYLLIFKINDYMMYKVELSDLKTEYEGKKAKKFVGRIKATTSILLDVNLPKEAEGNFIERRVNGTYDIYVDGFENYSYIYNEVKSKLDKTHTCHLLVMKIISGEYSINKVQHLFE